MRNHADAVLACDFFIVVTAMFQTAYVFVVLEVDTRRIIHWNVTAHPTAASTIQPFRAIVPGDQPQRFLDRDSVYAAAVDDAVTAMGLTVLTTRRSAGAQCVPIGTVCPRRHIECAESKGGVELRRARRFVRGEHATPSERIKSGNAGVLANFAGR